MAKQTKGATTVVASANPIRLGDVVPFQHLGTCIVEQGFDVEFLMMYPDGTVEILKSRADAEVRAKRWALERTPPDGCSLLRVEHRF